MLHRLCRKPVSQICNEWEHWTMTKYLSMIMLPVTLTLNSQMELRYLSYDQWWRECTFKKSIQTAKKTVEFQAFPYAIYHISMPRCSDLAAVIKTKFCCLFYWVNLYSVTICISMLLCEYHILRIKMILWRQHMILKQKKPKKITFSTFLGYVNSQIGLETFTMQQGRGLFEGKK